MKHEIVTGDSPPVMQSSFRTERESGWETLKGGVVKNLLFPGPARSACEKEVVLVRKKCGGFGFVLTRGDLMQSPTGMFLPYPELMIF